MAIQHHQHQHRTPAVAASPSRSAIGVESFLDDEEPASPHAPSTPKMDSSFHSPEPIQRAPVMMKTPSLEDFGLDAYRRSVSMTNPIATSSPAPSVMMRAETEPVAPFPPIDEAPIPSPSFSSSQYKLAQTPGLTPIRTVPMSPSSTGRPTFPTSKEDEIPTGPVRAIDFSSHTVRNTPQRPPVPLFTASPFRKQAESPAKTSKWELSLLSPEELSSMPSFLQEQATLESVNNFVNCINAHMVETCAMDGPQGSFSFTQEDLVREFGTDVHQTRVMILILSKTKRLTSSHINGQNTYSVSRSA